MVGLCLYLLVFTCIDYFAVFSWHVLVRYIKGLLQCDSILYFFKQKQESTFSLLSMNQRYP